MFKHREKHLASDRQKLLTEWFQSRLGQLLAEQERTCLERRLASLFGYYLIQIGVCDAKLDLLRSSPAKSKLLLDLDSQNLSLRADPLHLPLATDSVDGVLMHHTIDFSRDPHQMLREVERILIPEGKLVIVGFNPWSLWGGWRLLHLHGRVPPWTGHFFSIKRVSDWLSLLGFDLLGVEHLNFRPPLQSQGLMQRLIFMERLGEQAWPLAGAVYVVEAVKRTLTLTPIRPKWRIGKKVLPATVEPTTRNLQ